MLGLLTTLTFMIIGYLIGGIPTGLMIARLYDVNIREVGSGNIGATNILRAVGLVPALIVVLTDPFKAFLATLLPVLLGMDPWTVALTGLSTLLGNVFNIFLGFRGGKGIATSLGVFLAVEPLITLFVAVLGIFTIALARYVSLGAMVGVLSAPLMLLARGRFEAAYLFLACAILALTFYRHRDNITRLRQGVERRLGEKVKPDSV